MGGDFDDFEDSDFGDEAEMGTTVDFDPMNRRTARRVDAEFRVNYQSLDEFVVAYTEDISRGGLFLATDKLMPTGSTVRLSLELPEDGPTIGIIGRVAYLRSPSPGDPNARSGMGMEFLDVEGGPLAGQLEAYLTLNFGDEKEVAKSRTSANILIVDPDEVESRRVVERLQADGHRVSSATAALEALGLVLQVPPDLIICEVDMPLMDGWTFLRLLRQRPTVAHIPVMFLSHSDSESNRLRGYRAGVDDFVSKMGAAENLSERIERVLNRAKGSSTRANKNAFRGDLSLVSLPSVLAFIEVEKRTGQMLVVQGNQTATLHIDNGNVIHVDLAGDESLVGIERLFHVLGWSEGQFELSSMEVVREPTITKPTGFAIMEYARRVDEGLL